MIDISAAKRIKGWMSKRELRWLARAAHKSRSILEVGCWRGRSTRAMADNTRGIIYAVDPWGLPYWNDDGTRNEIDTDVYSSFVSNLSDYIRIEKVIPVQKCFCDFYPPEHSFDFIFIDGDHRYQTVIADIDHAMTLLKPKGLLAGHDYRHNDWPGVRAAVDERFGKKINVIDSIWHIT